MNGKTKEKNEKENDQNQSKSIIISSQNNTQALATILNVMQAMNVTVEHLESRKSRNEFEWEIFLNIILPSTNETFDKLINQLKEENCVKSIREVFGKVNHDEITTTTTTTPWFPKHIQQLDLISNRVLMNSDMDLDSDHPGVNDAAYCQRRMMFADIAFNYRHGQPIPRIDYTKEEVKTWGIIYRELNRLYNLHACREYLENLELFKQHCGYSEDNIPQLEDISNFLKERTGFIIRPVAGYLSSRDFLAALAFRVFHSTQYLRHPDNPFYTPEPDCCHELLGHMPLLADAAFAQFSQEIGLASLGTSDEDVQKLATMYFFTVEFGMCYQDGQLRAYGAGLLSSVAELKFAMSDSADIRAFEPNLIIQQQCYVTQFQDMYFFTHNFQEAKDKLREFSHSLKRPFDVSYNAYTQSIEVLDNPQSIAKVVDEVKAQLNVVSTALNKLII